MIAKMQREVKWELNGMEYPRLNCWGLVRHVRSAMFGLPVLPSTPDISAHDKKRLTERCAEITAESLQEITTPVAGCIATAWRNRLCVHVGIVVESEGRLCIMDCERAGVRVMRAQDWAARFLRVVYYHDR